MPTSASQDPGSYRSSLGPIPGAGGNPFGGTPGTDQTFLGGRPGPSFPRVPSEVTTPGAAGTPPAPGIVAPARLPVAEVPVYGTLELPAAAEEEGPPGGMTLDAAVERLVRENLPLQALRWQIPAARADVLTAGLRANPVLYADVQLVPYGARSTRERPEGPTQYDLNVNHPVDFSGKRLARTEAARRVVSVQEARYQDAVRSQIDNLYTVFVDVLAARETLRFTRASRVGLERFLAINQTLYENSTVTRADVGRVSAMLNAARIAGEDAEALYLRTRRALGLLLNLPPDAADVLSVRGTIADNASPPPPADALVRAALEFRPDLIAYRLGVARAEADVRLARANRFGDAYVLYQPYTLQDNSPIGLQSATSWALGLTVQVPVYNRNQGGVARARLNVGQTRAEVATVERRVVAEVRDAEREYQLSRDLLRMMEADLLPAALRMREDTFKLFAAGQITALEASNTQRDYNRVVRQYRDTLTRHRRSMLALNTAVGRRILP